MKIIKRYVLSEYISATLFGLVVFTFILLLDQIFQFVDMIITKGVGFYDALALFALMLPNIFSMSMPISSLFGGILSYGRLSGDNEITAMKTAGLNYFSFISPPIFLNLIMAAVLIYYNLNVYPHTYRKFNEYYFEIVQKRPALKIEEKSIIKIGDNRIYFEEKDKDGWLLNVNIFQFGGISGSMVPTIVISASSATVSITASEILFKLYSGMLQKINTEDPSGLTMLNFARYNVAIPIDHSAQYTKSLREYTGGELLSEIRTHKKQSLPTAFFETEFNLRLAVGFAAFFFALIGVPLGLTTHRGTKSSGFMLSLVMIFCYYIFLAIGISFSDKGYLPSAFSLQIPNIATALFAVFFWRKILKK